MPTMSMETPMDASQMALVFFNSDSTPLFLRSWAPSRSSTYAWACISIAILAVIHRLLIATRDIVLKDPPGAARTWEKSGLPPPVDDEEKTLCLSRYGIPRARLRQQSPVTTKVIEALWEVLISLVGYAVMLAAMTMNIGYFLSALGGIFIGTLLAGRFSTSDDGSCH